MQRAKRMVNYKEIEEKVKNKSSNTVLVAVSKTKPIELILEAYDQGARIFGENRVQELVAKFSENKKEDMKVYLIGQLQSNKVKKAVMYADRIESVDSISLLDKINVEAGKINKKIEILLEVNSSFEEQKSGFRTRDEVISASDYASKLENISLVGLMTVGPLGCDDEKNRKAFLYTKEIFDEISKTHPLSVLSMGMSGDWESAIECGSTEVRIGTAIFGGRS